MNSFSVFAVLLLAVPAVAQKVGEVEKVMPSSSAPKGKTLQATSAEGQPYWYRLPKKIDAKQPPNLILMLHGSNMPYGWAFWNYQLESGSFRGRDILVAPEGLTPGQSDAFNFIQGKQDGDQIAGLIKLFKKQFPVNKAYLYGHSQGAFFAYWFAGEYTELVDGVVAHAGNVLSVNHNRLAKEKVAIGILHGEADAVVPVECAHRTEKIYLDQGYKKVKKYIVEGLNERTGHWPLPQQVLEMFEWLDQVSADSADSALAVAWSELNQETPDLAVVVEVTARSRKLLKKYRGEDKDRLTARSEAVDELLAEIEIAHTDALLQEIGDGKSKEFAPWMVHFRIAHQVFRDSPSWQKSMKRQISLAKQQDKIVGKAIDRLNAKEDGKSVANAMSAIETSPLAQEYDTLVSMVSSRLVTPPKGLKEATVASHEALTAARTEAVEQGQAHAAEIVTELATRFVEQHTALFEP